MWARKPTPAVIWYDAVYLSKDQVFDPTADIKLGVYTRPRSLLVGEGYVQSADVFIPSGSGGPYFIIVVANSGSSLNEYGAVGNNMGIASAATIVSFSPPADLAVNAASVSPASVLAGGSVTINWTVGNVSTNPAVGQWTDALFLSPSPVWDLSAVPVGYANHGGGLNPSATYNNSLPVNVPPLTPGAYYAYVRTDVPQ